MRGGLTVVILHVAPAADGPVPGRAGAAPTLSRPEWPGLQAFGPNWFAAVMGTGIVAVAGAGLPVSVPGLRAVALGFWLLACLLLVLVTGCTAVHWIRHRAAARSHVADPLLAHFYGAPPMALMTVGAGALAVGRDAIGLPAAVALDRVLWGAGSVAGLACFVGIPFLRFLRTRTPAAEAGGAWLMSVVPPMVSASTGALLVPHTPAGPQRLTLLVACYVMFALSLLASIPVVALVVRRLARRDVGPAHLVPTLWIVLGPLGQSVTAAGLLAAAAARTVPYPSAAQAFALGYGLTAATFAVAWLGVAASLTLRQARRGLPFALTWWAFTFPVGTCVTGATVLAGRINDPAPRAVAGVLFGLLLVMWLVVARRTVAGVCDGTLLRRPAVPAVRIQGLPQP